MEQTTYRQISVIIPAYRPDEKLAKTVADLRAVGFSDILIVDDGSGAAYAGYFPQGDGITRLAHENNRGKGAALKTAFAYLAQHRRDIVGAVCVDCDGQHKARDAARCAEKLMEERGAVVLGCRDFSGANVPLRSRFGNRATSLLFRLFLGIKLGDTQTGLRAYPASTFAAMCKIEGDRYEYETNQLLALKSLSIPYVEVPIETVYLEENKSSHFRPIRDSLRIFSLMLKFVAGSLMSFLLEALILWGILKILHAGYGAELTAARTAACMIFARICSSAFNFAFNRRRVFHAHGKLLPNLLRYYAVALPMMLIYSGATTLLKQILGATTPFIITLISSVVSTLLYFISFRLQGTWVFRRK